MLEYFDIVNKKDRVIGKAPRWEAHEKHLIHRAVIIFVFNPKGELFIQKRSKAKDVFPKYYTGSATGHVSAGQTYLQAAVRELREELGINAKPEKLRKVCTFFIKATEEKKMVALYLLKNYSGKINLQKEELSWGKFLAVKKIMQELKRKKFTPSFRKAFKMLMKNANGRIT